MEDGPVVVVHRRHRVLVQQAHGDQLLHALLGKVGVDGLGAVAQEGGEVVHIPGFGALQDHGHGGALLGAHQILLQSADRQQGGDGHVVFIHAPVREDQNVGAFLVGTVHVDKQPVQGVFQRGALVVEQGDGLHMEAGPVHIPDLHQVHGGENGVVDLEHRAVFRPLLQQIAAGTHVDGGIGDDLLPDGVHGGIGHLGKELLEVVEQGLMVLAEHRQRRVHAHGGGGLRPVPGHGEDGVLYFFIGVAEGLVQPVPQLLGVSLHPPVGDGQVLEGDQMGVQPLAVGLPGGAAVFDLLILQKAPLPQVRQQHLAGLEPGLFHNGLRRQVQHAYL